MVKITFVGPTAYQAQAFMTRGARVANEMVCVPMCSPEGMLDFIRARCPDAIPIPLAEEAVLPCFRAGHPGIGPRWIDRGDLRSMLPSEISPPWARFGEHHFLTYPVVVKAPASSGSCGVRFSPSPSKDWRAATAAILGAREEIERLSWAGSTPLRPIVEEYIPGPQYEVCGVVGAGRNQVHVTSVLRHEWSNSKPVEGAEITRYHVVNDADGALHRLFLAVACAMSARWCFMCVETRYSPDQKAWVVIDAHCRPGDDDPAKGYSGEEQVQVGGSKLLEWANA